MSNEMLIGIILGVAGIIVSVILSLKSVRNKQKSQTQKTTKGGVNIQSGRDTKINDR